MGLINISINLDKIDKSKIIQGKQGKYLNISVNSNMNGEDQYGNTHHVIQTQSKEERQAKADKIYLGNGKEFIFNNNNNNNTNKSAEGKSEVDDDLPF